MVRIIGRNDPNMGPGSYQVPLNTLGKKSFNTRVNSSLDQALKVRSPKKSPGTSNSFLDPAGTKRTPLRRHSFQGTTPVRS